MLAILDRELKSATGYGTIDLQRSATAEPIDLILVAWSTSRRAILAGFSLGFDYLFMALYGIALFYGGLVARERFTPDPGMGRRIMLFLCAVPLAGMLLDAVENAIELSWLLQGVTDRGALIGNTITNAKWLCIFVGLALSVAALAGRFVPHRT